MTREEWNALTQEQKVALFEDADGDIGDAMNEIRVKHEPTTDHNGDPGDYDIETGERNDDVQAP